VIKNKIVFFEFSVGIDIPDYIASSFGKSEALKEMSDKMQNLGRK
jgi:hypothetical protein